MKMSRVKHVLRTKDAIVIIAIDIDFFISLYLSLYLDTLTAHKQLIHSPVLYLVFVFPFFIWLRVFLSTYFLTLNKTSSAKHNMARKLNCCLLTIGGGDSDVKSRPVVVVVPVLSFLSSLTAVSCEIINVISSTDSVFRPLDAVAPPPLLTRSHTTTNCTVHKL